MIYLSLPLSLPKHSVLVPMEPQSLCLLSGSPAAGQSAQLTAVFLGPAPFICNGTSLVNLTLSSLCAHRAMPRPRPGPRCGAVAGSPGHRKAVGAPGMAASAPQSGEEVSRSAHVRSEVGDSIHFAPFPCSSGLGLSSGHGHSPFCPTSHLTSPGPHFTQHPEGSS